ncbi:MAG TPA: FliH/SctL family protein [Bryobacteraceae bacterium]|nr:FliH/SctL family protein [Bryobacteraceae bacterium]
MSSKILPSGEPAAPVLWRVVDALGENRAGNNRAEVQRAVDQARREAYAEGVAAGRQQAEEQVRPAVAGLAQVLQSLSSLREDIREQTNQQLVHLAISIAGRILHREVSIDPDALSGLVKAAYLKLQSRELNRVRMHPTLEVLVRKVLDQSGSPKNLVLTPDPALNPGEVFFETSQGLLDASVDTQLREIERGLIDRLEQ